MGSNSGRPQRPPLDLPSSSQQMWRTKYENGKLVHYLDIGMYSIVKYQGNIVKMKEKYKGNVDENVSHDTSISEQHRSQKYLRGTEQKIVKVVPYSPDKRFHMPNLKQNSLKKLKRNHTQLNQCSHNKLTCISNCIKMIGAIKRNVNKCSSSNLKQYIVNNSSACENRKSEENASAGTFTDHQSKKTHLKITNNNDVNVLIYHFGCHSKEYNLHTSYSSMVVTNNKHEDGTDKDAIPIRNIINFDNSSVKPVNHVNQSCQTDDVIIESFTSEDVLKNMENVHPIADFPFSFVDFFNGIPVYD